MAAGLPSTADAPLQSIMRKIGAHGNLEPSLLVEACCVPKIIEFILHAPADVSCA